MKKCIAAHTNLDPIYPGYVNISRDEDGSVIVSVRSDPTTHPNRAYICGYAADRGKPGRCTPGDESCNNYCNMAPQKGPMQDHPLPCSQTFCGETAAVRLDDGAWRALIAALIPDAS